MKKLAELAQGARFLYGGVEWVKLEDIGAGTLCLAAEPVFLRAFDEENCNDWRKSSLRRELNGAFLDALVAEGADRAAFLDWESDLTADDGMTDYGTAVDKIALRSDALCRKYRDITPPVDAWCWNLTPWTCDPEYSCYVRYVDSSGTLVTTTRTAATGAFARFAIQNLQSWYLFPEQRTTRHTTKSKRW